MKKKEFKTLAQVLGFAEPKNDPELAYKRLKEDVKKLGKDDTLIIHACVPKNVAIWLKRYCKKNDIYLAMYGESFKYSIRTVADKQREKEEQERHRDFWDTWFNSPG